MVDGKSQRSGSTGEAGEPTRGTPWREGERRITEPLRGKTMETPISGTVSTRLQRIADPRVRDGVHSPSQLDPLQASPGVLPSPRAGDLHWFGPRAVNP